MGSTSSSKKKGSTKDNDDDQPPRRNSVSSIESDKDASPKLDIVQADLEGNSSDVHPGLPDKTKLIVVNGLPALTTNVRMGIAAIRGFQWIRWKCMCIQQGDRWRALVAHREQKTPDVGPALLALLVGHLLTLLRC